MDDGSEIEDVTKKGNFSSTFMAVDEHVPDELYGNLDLLDAAHAEAAEIEFMMTSSEVMPSVAQKIQKQKKKFHEAKELDVKSPLPSLPAFQFHNDLMALDPSLGVSSKLL